MAATYDMISAKHYAAYRPPLHGAILGKCIGEKDRFAYGLDIGCGTGRSSVAMAKFCDKVMAIDPSEAMLSNAIQHPDIAYQAYGGTLLPFQDNLFDMVTFAGSWYYAKSQKLLDEVSRISIRHGEIFVYDFEVVLADWLRQLGISMQGLAQGYNHQENFDGLLCPDIKMRKNANETTTLGISAVDMSHLLLSTSLYHKMLAEKFGPSWLHEKVAARLAQIAGHGLCKAPVNLYYSVYTCTKQG